MPPKNQPQANLWEVLNQCLRDFFDENSFECSCASLISSLVDEISDCKSVINTQNGLILQLLNDTASLTADIEKLKLHSSASHVNKRKSVTLKKKTSSVADKTSSTELNRLSAINNNNNITYRKSRCGTNNSIHDNVNSSSSSDESALKEDIVSTGALVHNPSSSELHTNVNVDKSDRKDRLEPARHVDRRPKNQQKRRQHIVGTNRTNLLQVAPKKAFLYVSRLSPNTTAESLKDYLLDGFPEVTCEQLHSKFSNHYSSFKVTIDLINKDKAMDSTLWPHGTYITRFFLRKPGGPSGLSQVHNE